MKVHLLDKDWNENTLLRFHIPKTTLHYFFNGKSNKSFLLFLILLELSHNKGFCYLEIKPLLPYLNLKSSTTICNWLRDFNNDNLIIANYNQSSHLWIIQINTPYHIRLAKPYKDFLHSQTLHIEHIQQESIDEIIRRIDESDIATEEMAQEQELKGEEIDEATNTSEVSMKDFNTANYLSKSDNEKARMDIEAIRSYKPIKSYKNR